MNNRKPFTSISKSDLEGFCQIERHDKSKYQDLNIIIGRGGSSYFIYRVRVIHKYKRISDGLEVALKQPTLKNSSENGVIKLI